ncbi:winged helix-turn-helix domain-containing protein [Streptomyces sudanensis]|uniref:Winged helix-turn-helix domain-containing protein n=1 Tax=Streptomyces sudanensis TaxID=436397 RepID=A0ABY4T7N3_9ACTN|nr:winged helix-turn-helix domain-containing protein [Streptomyces sudanensis]
MIGQRFRLTYAIQGVRKPLVRNGWSYQVQARRAMERYDEAVAGWAREAWPCAEESRW